MPRYLAPSPGGAAGVAADEVGGAGVVGAAAGVVGAAAGVVGAVVAVAAEPAVVGTVVVGDADLWLDPHAVTRRAQLIATNAETFLTAPPRSAGPPYESSQHGHFAVGAPAL